MAPWPQVAIKATEVGMVLTPICPPDFKMATGGSTEAEGLLWPFIAM